ncbi:MAG: DUF305 domain-containing protein, partial [Gammaproteobacteria bacterium]|nr:DUF305 domain-containing protein [Gammaproteobacteria bacterium]
SFLPRMRTGMMADDPDIAFACGMIAHHQGAIVMAETERKYGVPVPVLMAGGCPAPTSLPW